ncbi:MAG: response regulator [Anaerolineales bacterium]|nr:MAG: response regulator [Anaerolineales bacterium]
MNKGRVLLVGGDPDVCRTLQVYLAAHQFSVQVVSHGGEALLACHQAPPDAVIFDWYLADMDGYDFCQQIRADECAANSFILALLSTNERDVRLAALEAGADDVMSQPIDIERLRLGIERTLGLCSSS